MRDEGKITFIGTGSGKTSSKRFHSSFIISTGEYKLLVDAGDGISKALLKSSINFDYFDGVLISHLHPDHYAGLASLIVQMKITGRTKKLQILTHHSLSETVKEFIYRSYIFQEKMDFNIEYIVFSEDEQVITSDSLWFIARQNSHLDDYKKFDLKNVLAFSCSSFLFGVGPINVFYSGDIGGADDLRLFGDHKIKIIITEISHVDFKEIVESERIIQPGKIYLTHISDEDEPVINEKISSLDDKLREKFTAAYDGLEIVLYGD